MLVQFRVENHRSLRDEQVLSLVATRVGSQDDERLIRPKGLGEALLPAVALYGANGSGKSNLMSALDFMREAVLGSYRLWEPKSGTPQEPFVLSNKEAESSLYEVDIMVEGVRYRYGFVISAPRVEEEWLYAWPHGRRQVLFQREGENFEFGKHMHGENEAIKSLTRANSLYLSTAAQNNQTQLMGIFGWFREIRFELRRGATRSLDPTHTTTLGDLFGTRRQLSLFQEDNDAYAHDRDAIVRLMQAADVGILDLKATDRENFRRERGSFRRVVGKEHDFFFLHKSQFRAAWLPLDWESSGTITLLGIATRLVAVLREGGMLCIDELEASLHPMLALEILRLFNDPKHNPRGAQLIFTTHDTNLLGNALGDPPLRRDQIWFTEKDETGATKLYPLTDFHPRKEENLERGYLQGRYGAIPFLGELILAPNDPEKG
jgi:AAA15 family ATPase/GTPase